MLTAAVAVAELCVSPISGSLAEVMPQSKIFVFFCGRGNEQKNWQKPKIFLKVNPQMWVFSHSMGLKYIMWPSPKPQAGACNPVPRTENGHVDNYKQQ